MKRFLTLLLLLALAGNAFAQKVVPTDSSYANGYYMQRLEFFRKMPDQMDEIVFLGNSITEQGEWQELIPAQAVVNRGISGDVSFGVLARLDEVLQSQPRQLMVMIGVNDLKRGTPTEAIAANYRKMVERIRRESPQTMLYLQSVLPVNEEILIPAFKKVSNQQVNELNKALQALSRQKKVKYVNLHEVFADANGQLKRELTTDGIHLRMPAYILWVDYLKKQTYL